MQKIGFGKGSIEQMDRLHQWLQEWEVEWEETNLKQSQLGLPPSVRSTGRPAEHALKPGNHGSRSNAVKIKKAYKCGICGKVGHTAGSKCPDKCWTCPKGTKNHMKGKCPPLKRGREDEARGMEDGNGAGQKMHIGEDEDEGMEDGIGTQVGKIVQSGDNSSQLHKGRSKYFSQWL